jgi:ArsR family transcriptional regulator
VSRHLAQLKGAGIVEDDKRGQMVFYRLRVKCLTGLFNCIESVVKCNVDHQLQVLTK